MGSASPPTFEKENDMRELPDGSGFFVGSLPLPKDHWLYAPNAEGWDSELDCSPDTPLPILDNSQREAVKAALRWAVRGATMNGKEPDFDPDALVLNAAYALCGPCGIVTPNVQLEGPPGGGADGEPASNACRRSPRSDG
jgi:hypothetical protein